MPYYEYKCINCGFTEELSLMAPPAEMIYSEELCTADGMVEGSVHMMKRQWSFGVGRTDGAGFSPARFPK